MTGVTNNFALILQSGKHKIGHRDNGQNISDMRQEMEIPKGDYCYSLRFFNESYECPYYDGTISMQPKCSKFKKPLAWSISGKVLKCQECKVPSGVKQSPC
jgi:hypothetical protein